MPIGHFWRMPWSTLAGALIGIAAVIAVPEMTAPIRNAYDANFPVLQMTGTVKEREADAVILHISGRKLRGEECRLMAVYGYAVSDTGRLSDATAMRVDQQQQGRPREAGEYDIGLWRVRPVGADAVGVKVMAAHDCLGRVVLSTIAEAKL
jgi:hypothetical protein